MKNCKEKVNYVIFSGYLVYLCIFISFFISIHCPWQTTFYYFTFCVWWGKKFAQSTQVQKSTAFNFLCNYHKVVSMVCTLSCLAIGSNRHLKKPPTSNSYKPSVSLLARLSSQCFSNFSTQRNHLENLSKQISGHHT